MLDFFHFQRANAKFTRGIRFYAKLRLASRDGSFHSSYKHNNLALEETYKGYYEEDLPKVLNRF